jgi:DNA excision repair protein ERCC-5
VDEMKLNRQRLISLAFLLGSDYTDGVSGVGIVNAMEIINAFSQNDISMSSVDTVLNPLTKFREWLEEKENFAMAFGCTVEEGLSKYGLQEVDKKIVCCNPNIIILSIDVLTVL